MMLRGSLTAERWDCQLGRLPTTRSRRVPLNINGKISTTPLWSCHPRPAPLANQPWPTRCDQRGQGMRPAHLLPTTACANDPKILNQPDLHMTMIPQPPPHNTLRRTAFSHPLCDASRCLLFANHGRGGQKESAKAGLLEMEPRRPPTIHCGRALNVVKEGPWSPALMLTPSTCVTSPTSPRKLLVPPLAVPAVLPGRGSLESSTGFGLSLVSSRPSPTRSPTLSLSTE